MVNVALVLMLKHDSFFLSSSSSYTWMKIGILLKHRKLQSKIEMLKSMGGKSTLIATYFA